MSKPNRLARQRKNNKFNIAHLELSINTKTKNKSRKEWAKVKKVAKNSK